MTIEEIRITIETDTGIIEHIEPFKTVEQAIEYLKTFLKNNE